MSLRDATCRELKLPDGTRATYWSLPALAENGWGDPDRLPYALRVLLESLLRMQGCPAYREEHVRALLRWSPTCRDYESIPFLPARVLLQDFTGVPCVADLAALRNALRRAGADPRRIEPRLPVDLVIDHSVQIDRHGTRDALEKNMALEFARNRERYAFLRWGQRAFRNMRIVPPGVGICHQVNLEFLATCVTRARDETGRPVLFPDTLGGPDSHTTRVHGLGVLGWGVGGIEAEAAMLGQPMPLPIPPVLGVRLTGRLPAGTTATDLALTVTQALRKRGVVGQFVEFFGPGVDGLSLADRATVANMAPEYGATAAFFPVDAETLRYLRETGRAAEHVDLVERYTRAQGLFRAPGSPTPDYSDVLELDLASVPPCVAGPKRPHDRLPLGDAKAAFERALITSVQERGFGLPEAELSRQVPLERAGSLAHGSVVIASITSCTNTSNPHAMLVAGLVARRAVEKGLRVPAFVKTSLVPGSRVVTAYLRKADLLEPLEKLGFGVAAYGCATCIGNSGPLPADIEAAVKEGRLVVAAVLSGNRNFEGRIHPLIRANFLCSPPLVVAYALAGRINVDLTREPLGTDSDGQPVFLKDLWPGEEDIAAAMAQAADPSLYRTLYQELGESHPAWDRIPAADEPVYPWDEASTYIREPPFVLDLPAEPEPPADLVDARVLVFLGDFVTTDHISPAGSIPADGPAGRYLISRGVAPADFNSFGARRGNHEVMVRGSFANLRLRNRLVDREGGWTLHIPSGQMMPIYDAALRYRDAGVPLVVLAGQMYGAGSSRDWAAKGTRLLGVRAILAESFERIHRSNLVGMGVLPLEFVERQTAESLGLTGRELFSVRGLSTGFEPGRLLEVTAVGPEEGRKIHFRVKCRVDSAVEFDYYRHGGILPYVLRMSLRRA